MSFWVELKRRNVFKVGAAYAVAAWLLIQVASVLLPVFGTPDWVMPVFAMLLVLGFPLAIVLAWVYEITPQGIEKTHQVASEDSITRVTGQRLNYVVIGLLVLAVAFMAVDNYLLRDVRTTNAATADGSAAIAAAASAASTAEQPDILPNSIAVLPIENLSPDPNNAYFADGMHEAILDQLAKLKNLNVISRTSVLQYRDNKPSIPEIARQLNVEAVMEASASFDGDRVLVSTQLIDGKTDRHIWSERYERPFDDVFKIQSDIAMNVANALAVEFSNEEQQAIERAPTNSAEAYALYLQALSLTNVDFAQGVALLERALSFDPNFALAHKLKAQMHEAVLVNTTGLNAAGGSQRDEQMRLARYHAARAGALDPSFAYLESTIANLFVWHWSEMLTVLDDVPDPLDQSSTFLYSYVGEHEKAVSRARRRLQLDPRNWNSYWDSAVTLHYAGDSDQAAGLLREGIALAPAVPVLRSWLAFVEVARGNFEEAAEEAAAAEQLLSEDIEAVYLPELAYSYSRIGRPTDVDRVIARIEQARDIDAGSGGRTMIYLARGDRVRAIKQLEDAVAKVENHQIDEGFWNLMNVRMNVTADPVLEEPEFVELRNQLRGD